VTGVGYEGPHNNVLLQSSITRNLCTLTVHFAVVGVCAANPTSECHRYKCIRHVVFRFSHLMSFVLGWYNYGMFHLGIYALLGCSLFRVMKEETLSCTLASLATEDVLLQNMMEEEGSLLFLCLHMCLGETVEGVVPVTEHVSSVCLFCKLKLDCLSFSRSWSNREYIPGSCIKRW
jgi:hypothetical protein